MEGVGWGMERVTLKCQVFPVTAAQLVSGAVVQKWGIGWSCETRMGRRERCCWQIEGHLEYNVKSV